MKMLFQLWNLYLLEYEFEVWAVRSCVCSSSWPESLMLQLILLNPSGLVPTRIWARLIWWPWRAEWRCPSAWPPPPPSRTWAGQSWAASTPRSAASLSQPTSHWWSWTCWPAPVWPHNISVIKLTRTLFQPEILAELNSLSVSLYLNRSFRNFVQSKSRSLNSFNRCIQFKTINIV